MTKKKDIIGSLSPGEAARVLGQMVKDPAIRKKAEAIALDMISTVDVDEVADDVFSALEFIDIEDVMDNSGASRYGYTDPGDCAWELFEDELEPFEDQLKRLHKFGMFKEARLHCMGILKGIHRFDMEANTEYSDWVVDAPGENIARIFEDWKKSGAPQEDITEVSNFLKSLKPGKL